MARTFLGQWKLFQTLIDQFEKIELFCFAFFHSLFGNLVINLTLSIQKCVPVTKYCLVQYNRKLGQDQNFFFHDN